MKEAIAFIFVCLLFPLCFLSSCGDGGRDTGESLCDRVRAKSVELKLDPFPSREEWEQDCPKLPKKALECAANATNVEEFHICGRTGTSVEGGWGEKKLCDRVYAKGIELKIEGASSKADWDIGCLTLPRKLLDCAAKATNAQEFLGCGE